MSGGVWPASGLKSAVTLTNIATFGLGAFYIAATFAVVQIYGLFVSTAGDDYRGYYAAGEVARSQGMAAAYTEEPLRTAQDAMVREYARTDLITDRYVTQGAPYLPVFIAFFEPLQLFDPIPGFAVWTAINLAALAGYLCFFVWRTTDRRALLIVPAFLFSFPAVDTLRWGQVSVWLMIFFGEFLRLGLRSSEFRSGLWLAPLLLKPQMLILVLPGLAIARRWRTLAGFVVSTVGLLAASIAIGGVDGLMSQAHVILDLSGDPAAARPENMMNWRAAAIALSDFLPTDLVSGLTLAASLGTLVAGLYLWRTHDLGSPTRFATVAAGTYSATSSIAWHSHGHMALPLAVPLLYLAGIEAIPFGLVALWLLAPYASLVAHLTLPHSGGQMGLLIAHLSILAWSVAAVRRRATAPHPQASHEAVAPVSAP